MISKEALIRCFERMNREHWRYVWGAAREGEVDCSGAFVYAFRQLGEKPVEHSSNAIARRSVGALQEARQARPGWAVFKWRRESETTPARWRDGRGDFYHVGLMGNGGKVLNAKGRRTGFAEDDLKDWNYAAPLLAVDDAGKGEYVLYRADVMTQEDPLRVREAPEDGEIIGHVPKGCVVDVLEAGAWAKIRFGGLTGWVSSDFLSRVDGKERTTLVRSDGVCITLEGSWKKTED